MSTNELLEIVEQDYRNIKALAREIGAEDALTDEVRPRESTDSADRVKFFTGVTGGAEKTKDLSEQDRAVALIRQNNQNLQKLAQEAGAEVARSDDEEETRTKFFGVA